MTKKAGLKKVKKTSSERYVRLWRRTYALVRAGERFMTHADWRRTGEGTGDPDSVAALKRELRLAKKEIGYVDGVSAGLCEKLATTPKLTKADLRELGAAVKETLG